MDISAYNLFWICPLCFVLGYFCMAVLSMARDSRDDSVREIRNVRHGRGE